VPIVSDESPGGNAAAPRRRVRNVKPRRPPTKPQRRPGAPLPREDIEHLAPFDKLAVQLDACRLPYTIGHADGGRRTLSCVCPSCESARSSSPSCWAKEMERGGKVAITCHKSGCRLYAILDPLHLEPSDIFPDGATDEAAIERRFERLFTSRERVDGAPVEPAVVERMAQEQSKYAEALAERPELLHELAARLGVTRRTLRTLAPGWRERNTAPGGYDTPIDYGGAWTFPMRDGQGRIVGVQRRFRHPDVRKRVIPGSRLGLFIPEGWDERQGPVLLPEGASDTLTLRELGFCAVGRPSNRAGGAFAAELLRGTDRKIVVIGDNDRKPDGAWPGDPQVVARALGEQLGRPVATTVPPDAFKDVRAWRQVAGDDEVREELKRRVIRAVKLAASTGPGC
jgi:hypothetical protein